jgi:hypothetical protein
MHRRGSSRRRPRSSPWFRSAIRVKPTPRALRRALYRALIASGDALTVMVSDRCVDRDYADAFGKALLRAE